MSVQTFSGSEVTHRNDILDASRKTLGAVCKPDIRLTFPELRHEFCDLWNEPVRTARTDQLPHHSLRSVSLKMLRNIRKLYIALHGTHRTDFNTTDGWEHVLDNLDSYPECTENDHRPPSFPDSQCLQDLLHHQISHPRRPSQLWFLMFRQLTLPHPQTFHVDGMCHNYKILEMSSVILCRNQLYINMYLEMSRYISAV
jgi:hypothetical protein